MIDLAATVGAIPPACLFAAAVLVFASSVGALVPGSFIRALSLPNRHKIIESPEFSDGRNIQTKSAASSVDTSSRMTSAPPFGHTYALTIGAYPMTHPVNGRSCAHPPAALVHRDAQITSVPAPMSAVVPNDFFVPSPVTIAPRKTRPAPRKASVPAQTESARVARQFVAWAIENGHLVELIREDVLRLARDHFAPGTGIKMPRDNHFLGSLKDVAGVECRSSRAVYAPGGRYLYARTTYQFWPKFAGREPLDRRQELNSRATV